MSEDYLWQYVMQINPFIKKDDVKSIEEMNDWDIVITFNDGRKILYDKCTGYYKNISYSDINELTEEQEKREFAYKLRSLMRRNYITQDELAAEINITQAMVSRYVRGETIPTAITLRKIAKALNCSMDDFFDRNF